MAKKSAHDIVLEFRSINGLDFKAYSRKGVILERTKGGTWGLAGKVKADLTVADVKRINLAKGFEYVHIMRVIDENFVFRTAALVQKQAKAKVSRAAKVKRLEEEAHVREATVLELPIVRGDDWNVPNALRLVEYMVQECLSGRKPVNAQLYYVYVMAQFHGGASSSNLHGPVMASWGVIEDLRPLLDAVADAVAEKAYGSNMRAANAWHRAFYGY